jgi:hypothetical protein
MKELDVGGTVDLVWKVGEFFEFPVRGGRGAGFLVSVEYRVLDLFSVDAIIAQLCEALERDGLASRPWRYRVTCVDRAMRVQRYQLSE